MLTINIVERAVIGFRNHGRVPIGGPPLVDHPRDKAVPHYADTVGVGDGYWTLNQTALGKPGRARHFPRCV